MHYMHKENNETNTYIMSVYKRWTVTWVHCIHSKKKRVAEQFIDC